MEDWSHDPPVSMRSSEACSMTSGEDTYFSFFPSGTSGNEEEAVLDF